MPRLDDEATRRFIKNLEYAHEIIDDNSNLGLLRWVIHCDALLRFLTLGTIGNNRPMLRLLWNDLQLLDNVIDESLVLEETFMTLLGYEYLKGHRATEDAEKIADLMLEEYPFCKETFDRAKELLTRFGLETVTALFVYAANVDLASWDEKTFSDLELRRRYLQSPLSASDSPDLRLSYILDTSVGMSKEYPNMDSQKFLTRVREKMSGQGFSLTNSLMKPITRDRLEEGKGRHLRLFDSLSNQQRESLDATYEYWTRLCNKLTYEDRGWNTKRFQSYFSQGGEVPTTRFSPVSHLYFYDQGDKWELRVGDELNYYTWFHNFCMTQLLDNATLGLSHVCPKDYVYHGSGKDRGSFCLEAKQRCYFCRAADVVSRLLPGAYTDHRSYVGQGPAQPVTGG